VGSLTRTQLLVYGAVGVALLLVGARWIRSTDSHQASAGGVSYGPGSSSSDGSFSVDAESGGDVVVDVAGEVDDPGVYRLPAGSRVTDAVQRAGGATAKGDLEQINLAARLADGQQIVIPGRAQAAAGVAAGSSNPASVDSGPISVGTATLEELDTIEGIGPITAQSILDYRDQHGGLSSIDQLDEIDGIGPATMDALRARLQP
jgi:competence protein ComEA